MRLTFSKPVFRQHPLAKNLLDETQLVRSKPASPAGSIPALRIRLASFHSAIIPCAKQLRGASDMARIVSRRASGREVPRMTRERSMGARRARLRESKELSFCERGGSAGTIPQTAGSGYLPPHQADTGRMDAGKAYALRKGMANLDRRI